MATTAETTTTTLKSRLTNDGRWKHSAPLKDIRRMTELCEKLRVYLKVPTLNEKADAVLVPLEALIEELTDK